MGSPEGKILIFDTVFQNWINIIKNHKTLDEFQTIGS